ncbi:hypothetical protein BO82DRAFT_147897 [Aspergillus uvarum CBS 121591]|uniref:Uncharacterized protein n=1 Tax=Aspergillus uvarum CBS 121591 TaxID=1448315 RepID=A0A319C4I1_9EURO|nr:hypothetical protein BO82DRAFT_147897 [Aspergillus uvarum CBS 121591]PYH78917.1 hypothetical protein BO82DRAFT_147897 [Aspergillus uvarum CBS 121591]
MIGFHLCVWLDFFFLVCAYNGIFVLTKKHARLCVVFVDSYLCTEYFVPIQVFILTPDEKEQITTQPITDQIQHDGQQRGSKPQAGCGTGESKHAEIDTRGDHFIPYGGHNLSMACY